MKFITERNGKFELYALGRDGSATKLFTAKTREACVERIAIMGATEVPAPADFTVKQPEAAPRLDMFAGMFR